MKNDCKGVDVRNTRSDTLVIKKVGQAVVYLSEDEIRHTIFGFQFDFDNADQNHSFP